LIAVTINVTPAAPFVSSPVVYCQGETASALTAIGTNIKWYLSATGGTALAAAPIPTTTATGSTTYYVSQTTGTCEGPRAAIVVNVNITPGAPIVTTPIALCQGTPPTALTATGTNLIWYSTATGGSGSSIAPSPVTTTVGSTSYYVSQTVGVCEGPRAAIVVNISAAPSITSQPQDITTCGTSATFTATASGTALTYQWQLSTDGGTTYTNIIGATSNVLTLTNLTAAQGNYKYRLLATSGTCTVAISNSVTAKIGITPVVVLTAAPVANFNPYTNGGLYTTVSPVGNYTYQWKRNNNILTNTGTSITKTNGLLDDFGSYVVTVTDVVTGCIGLSNAVSISDIDGTRGQLFISPNPTTGLIRVSFYSSTIAAQNYSVNVYDEKGARVIVKDITLTGRYGSASLDLTSFAKGTYVVILRDASGNKVASNKVVKY
jgi:Ig-like domain CHU_C associated/Secretion system C-terminal sorting domain